MCKKTVTETCPHCENTFEKEWNTKKSGFITDCPNCGHKVFLCGECLEYGNKAITECDWNIWTCSCHRLKEMEIK